jgi:hypothetical protein
MNKVIIIIAVAAIATYLLPLDNAFAAKIKYTQQQQREIQQIFGQNQGVNSGQSSTQQQFGQNQGQPSNQSQQQQFGANQHPPLK